jgi:hypothetical protein
VAIVVLIAATNRIESLAPIGSENPRTP